MKKTLIHQRTDPAVFKGGIAGKTATILIHQVLLSDHEALRAVRNLVRGKKADNRKLFLRFKGL
ncbi:hypothetical protein CG436_04215 [Pantoea ananatis]|uniref:hypothetical protein n=1 Tax=Pantoea ananas TaxID=553 RepID=UPI0002323035|nr:hypothetical protein [Pantoea ananatis]AER32232.1 hypothetical protein PAGR_g1713 [Pantoea ananatis PA13]AVG77378.1 hypothetical protein B9Q16_15700 [Pantoea ananatis]PQK95996.1 hypothetical protein CG433_04180 [Pantoea ananatis]PQL09090.1 hypothetical protein CG436_04215 [Pantoea ananatis]HCN01015.1 hypothetical protein [Pantoea ananatis]